MIPCVPREERRQPSSFVMETEQSADAHLQHGTWVNSAPGSPKRIQKMRRLGYFFFASYSLVRELRYFSRLV
jgi:hypothetical protein